MDKPVYVLWFAVILVHRNREVTVYKYDRAGRLEHSYTYDSETMLNQSGISMTYDESSRLSCFLSGSDDANSERKGK